MACRLSSKCYVFSLLTLSMCASSVVDECSAASKSFDPDRESLLQIAVKSTPMQEDATLSEPPPTCSPLTNRGSHFTVAVEVGTPPQRFDLVADTGSNAVIVDSCICQERGQCDSTDRCFRGTNRSHSFAIEYTKRNGSELPANMLSIKFGSGIVEAAVASDVVKVGQKITKMNKNLLLMIGKYLDFSGSFEGILGLGLPNSDLSDSDKAADDHNSAPAIGGFLETAHVPRFGVCFNPGADGVLRLGQAAASEQLGAVGKSHWALSYGGYSIGGDKLDSPCSKLKNAESCVAIPDSGTTLIMAPATHIVSLFASLCSRWERCKNSKHALQKPQDEDVLADAFQRVLLRCNNYTSASHGLDDELPAINLDLRGSNGNKRTLTLPGVSYVYETMEDEVHYVREKLLGIFPIDIPVPTGRKKRVCTPAFGAMNMNSTYSGPVWILGQPIFYEFQVGYELASHPPTMSFTKESCGSCNNGVVQDNALLVEQRRTVARRPALVRGPARLPSIDLSQPL